MGRGTRRDHLNVSYHLVDISMCRTGKPVKKKDKGVSCATQAINVHRPLFFMQVKNSMDVLACKICRQG